MKNLGKRPALFKEEKTPILHFTTKLQKLPPLELSFAL
jgi:hypothetical protein